MVQIIPRVIFTLPSTISKKENDFITFLFWFPLYFYLLHQWRPTWLPCWRWNRELCWHWQFCGIWKVARITSLGLKCITDFSFKLTKGSRNEDGNYQFQAVHSPHLASVRLGQGLAWDHLQQQHELQAISEVLLDVLDLGSSFS